MNNWLVIGVSGVTCGGKTTISRLLHRAFPWAHVINQDKYFLPPDSDRHVWVTEINHQNWEILSSMDMDAMWNDIKCLLNSTPDCKTQSDVIWPNMAGSIDHINLPHSLLEELKRDFSHCPILILDGLLICNYKPISDLCHLKYYITVSREVCEARRNERTYDPPDPPKYFEKVVWPMFEKHRDEVKATVAGVEYCDGEQKMEQVFHKVLQEVTTTLKSRCGCMSAKK